MNNSTATRLDTFNGSQAPPSAQRIFTIVKALALTTVLSCLLVAYYVLVR